MDAGHMILLPLSPNIRLVLPDCTEGYAVPCAVYELDSDGQEQLFWRSALYNACTPLKCTMTGDHQAPLPGAM